MENKQDSNNNIKNEKKDMPIRDNLFLSPIEKYKFYGRFPWKMIIHMLLVILTTTQVIDLSLNLFEFEFLKINNS